MISSRRRQSAFSRARRSWTMDFRTASVSPCIHSRRFLSSFPTSSCSLSSTSRAASNKRSRSIRSDTKSTSTWPAVTSRPHCAASSLRDEASASSRIASPSSRIISGRGNGAPAPGVPVGRCARGPPNIAADASLAASAAKFHCLTASSRVPSAAATRRACAAPETAALSHAASARARAPTSQPCRRFFSISCRVGTLVSALPHPRRVSRLSASRAARNSRSARFPSKNLLRACVFVRRARRLASEGEGGAGI
mmetsp:Transcript_3231/g.6703  ORF Transcript_3231/g.6703 Transcript_3231/m.6703 type:complete len:253 (-) Transcript_3231:121-879(-)